MLDQVAPRSDCCAISGERLPVKSCTSRAILLAAALLASGGNSNVTRANDETAAMKELIPTGKLRVGIVFAPALSAFFAVKDADGRPRGVTADLANELAQQLGVSPEFMVVPNSGLATDATESGAIDVAFMPVDDERKKRVDFGPNYCLIESTYMVTGGSGIKTLAEVDRPNVRVVGIAKTTTIRAAGRTLKNTTITAATSVEEAVEMLRTGKADAFALSRDSLPPFVAQLPGSRIVDGGFQQTGIAIAVPKNRSNALAYVSAFLENAKASGSVRRALDRAGFRDEPVAPPAR
jgi:polar amino acid transport system substrate-binding protein